MPKPEFVFYWDGFPGNRSGEDRADLARRFRAYRRRGSGFRLWRDGPGRYCVACLLPGSVWTTDSDVIGVFERAR